jgi:DNA invertase Pin-like site-specific DNA recombinase
LTLYLRISGLYLNHVKPALSARSAIFERILRNRERNETATIEHHRVNIYGENVKMASEHKLKLKLLTPTERDEVAEKYKSGMSKIAIADLYSCHPTTVGRILRRMGLGNKKP